MTLIPKGNPNIPFSGNYVVDDNIFLYKYYALHSVQWGGSSLKKYFPEKLRGGVFLPLGIDVTKHNISIFISNFWLAKSQLKLTKKYENQLNWNTKNLR